MRQQAEETPDQTNEEEYTELMLTQPDPSWPGPSHPQPMRRSPSFSDLLHVDEIARQMPPSPQQPMGQIAAIPQLQARFRAGYRDPNPGRTYNPQNMHRSSRLYPEISRRVRPTLEPVPPRWFGNLLPGARAQIFYHVVGPMEVGGPDVHFVQHLENRVEDQRWGMGELRQATLGHRIYLQGQPRELDLLQFGRFSGDITESLFRFFFQPATEPF